MLRVHQVTSPAAAKGYYARSDYYGEGRETQGRWFGKGAEQLGLTGAGSWSPEAFDRLCDNLHPTTPGRLTARQRADRTVAYDFNFNAPKGVSLLYALTGDARVLDAFQAAFLDTLRDIEKEMKTRVRKNGQDAERRTGNLVSSAFVHFTTRPVGGVPDPSLHAHAVVFNATWDPKEQAWKAGYFRDLKRDAPYWEAAFHARLAANLRSAGYATERRGKAWDVACVSRATARRFSRRTEQIEALADRLGVTDPEAKARLGATSRAAKGKPQPWSDLVAAWDARLTEPERRTLHAARTAAILPVASPADAEVKSVGHAVAHLFARQSVVPLRSLLTEALRHGVGAVDVAATERATRRQHLILREDAGRTMAVSGEALGQEREILRFAKAGRGTRSRLGTRGRALRRPWLAPDQRRAVEHVLTSTDKVILVRGVAGTGKTTLTQEAVEAIEENGRRVVMLAPSAEASRGVLRSEGFADADTVERFLTDENLRERARGGVIWVDEAGLLSVPDTHRLFQAAGALDARVVLMGDARQHASPSRGAAFHLLQQEGKLPVAEVADIRRQTGLYKQAVRQLSTGQVAEGLATLDGLGWIREAPEEDRYRALAAAYADTLAEGKSALAISPTHAEGERVTAAIREELGARGRLGEGRAFRVWQPRHLTEAERADAHAYEPGDMIQFHRHAPGVKAGERLIVAGEGEAATLRDVREGVRPFGHVAAHAGRFAAYRPAALTLAVGDRVRITANGKTKDGRHRLNNGAVFTVTGFTPRGDLVVDHHRVIDRDWGHLAHGYVLTSHASQGKTVDRVFLAQSAQSLPASGREQMYVSASRARERVLIFTDDKQALQAAADRADCRETATEFLKRRRHPLRQRAERHLELLRRAYDRLRPGRPAPAPAHEPSEVRGVGR